MKLRRKIPARLLAYARWISIPICAISFAMFLRTTYIGTNDLFHFGKRGSWWCYAIVNFWHISASVESYEPGYKGGWIGTPGTWFYFHIAANGGIWSVTTGDIPNLVASHDFVVYFYQRYELAGRPAYTNQGIDLGPILPISLAVSACILGFWIRERIRARKLARLGLCPTCNYDLRAHTPNAKCPECGTPIPSSPRPPNVQ